MTNYKVTEKTILGTHEYHVTGCKNCDETGRTYTQGYDHDSGCSPCEGSGLVHKVRDVFTDGTKSTWRSHV